MKRAITENEPLLWRDILWRWSLNLGQKKKENTSSSGIHTQGHLDWMVKISFPNLVSNQRNNLFETNVAN